MSNSYAQRTIEPNTPDWLANLVDFYQEHKAIALGIMAAVILIPAGTVFYLHQRTAADGEAQSKLARADQEFYTGNVAAATTFYQDVISGYSGTTSADLAQVGLGRAAMLQGKPADALKAFSAATGSRDALVAAAARRGHAAALEDTGKPADAAKEYAGVAAAAAGDAASDDLISAARAYLAAKDPGPAKVALQKVIALTPDSSRKQDALRMMAEMR